LKQPISITAISSISPLGHDSETVWKNYVSGNHFFSELNGDFVAQLNDDAKKEIEILRHSNSKYKQLDNSVLFGIYVARHAVKSAGWNANDNFGVNIGSSRGATGLFETYFKNFLTENKTQTLSSPTTTLGNISSWIAHDLQTKGPEISHSITCSTALHSLLNGVAWINSGMCSQFLVGGSEAPLTDFTIAQMQALKVYSKEIDRYPCKAFDLQKTKNTMVLGEGTAAVCLEKGIIKNAIATIEGIGYATEVLKHNTSVTTDAVCFQKSMKMAIQNIGLNEIDIIVMHSPGTIKGDLSEVNAIKKIFGNNLPFLTTNKWKIGHTFGSSGLLSLELGLLMLQHQQVIKVPFAEAQNHPKEIKKILVNAVGFGGNAVSVLISK